MTAFLHDRSDDRTRGAASPTAESDREAPGEQAPTRVLIAEDEWIVAAALRRQVQAYGYQVIGTVGTGTEVLALCDPEHPAVVLMDIQMPEMDGLTATRRLMTTSPCPVAIITGNASLREAADEAGAMDYVVKPVLAHQIPAIIGRAQQHFGWFSSVAAEAASREQALEDWQLVRQAIRHLAASQDATEEQAFGRIKAEAAEARVSLRQAAERLLEQNG